MLTIAMSLQAPVEHLVRRAVQAGAGTVLIVPEQLSHETERRLCVLGGDSVSLRAEVLSFTRLAQRVFSICGGAARKRLDGAGRLLVMRRAVEELRSRMKYFASALGREQFLSELLQAVDELKSCRISPEQLAQASQRLEGVQAQKLEELGLLLATSRWRKSRKR